MGCREALGPSETPPRSRSGLRGHRPYPPPRFVRDGGKPARARAARPEPCRVRHPDHHPPEGVTLMPRRKVPGADYATPTIDPRELPNDVVEEHGPVLVTDEPVLDIRTLHNHSMPQLLKIAQELEVEGAPALRKQ